MNIALIATLGLLGVGMLLVVFGTAAKNRWGINLGPIVCPNCKAQIPQVRNPQNLRQALWGGGYCPHCAVEVDKWGRLIETPSPKLALSSTTSFAPKSRRTPLLFSVPFFCLTLVWNWSEAKHFPEPFQWLSIAVPALFETAVATVLYWFAMKYLLGRWFGQNPGVKQ